MQIIHHQSSIINSDGFTLIELLVVISIIALLLAILFPALRAARSHARTATCQATLHQWGLYYAMYTAENEYRMPVYDDDKALWLPDVLPKSLYKRSLGGGHYADLNVYKGLLFCPEASGLPVTPEVGYNLYFGNTHSPWARGLPGDTMSSYGFNGWTPGDSKWIASQLGKPVWVSCLVKGAASVPTYFDCMLDFAIPQEADLPAPIEDAPKEFLGFFGMPVCVMDRHRGGINSLFMDWSVRKVGLKEAWTLKWSPEYDTAGPWTKQGGVQPGDWPQWMQRFKDY